VAVTVTAGPIYLDNVDRTPIPLDYLGLKHV
jgi:hypothetical protein